MEATPTEVLVQVPEPVVVVESQPEGESTVEKKSEALEGLDGVYKRDEYCKAQFWDDRFKG
jgi:hypothetical protein